MRRFFLRLIAVMSLGVATTLSVAWGIALIGIDEVVGDNDSDGTSYMPVKANGQAWLFHRPGNAAGATVLRTSRAWVHGQSGDVMVSFGGCEIMTGCKYEQVAEGPDGRLLPTLATDEREEFRFGWPFRAVRSTRDFNHPPIGRSFSRDAEAEGPWSLSVVWSNVLPDVPDAGVVFTRVFWSDANIGGPRNWAVPIGLLPLGFALNTGVFTVAWTLILIVPPALRRSRRRRRGACVWCGYDIGGNDAQPCPECGHSFGVPRVAR